MTPEQHRQLNYLATVPAGSITMKHDDLQTVLLETGGKMLACGMLYNFDAKPIGAGVYRVTLALTHP